MALSEAEKQRIKEEESYRAQIKSELSANHEKKKGVGCLKIGGLFVGIPIAIILFITILILGGTNTSKLNNSNTPTEVDRTNLKATVNFDGTSFLITNIETKDWANCWFRLNNDYFYPSDAPSIKLDIVKVGETLALGAGELTKKDGTRFNPFTIKPKEMSASCDETRFGYWTWQ